MQVCKKECIFNAWKITKLINNYLLDFFNTVALNKPTIGLLVARVGPLQVEINSIH